MAALVAEGRVWRVAKHHGLVAAGALVVVLGAVATGCIPSARDIVRDFTFSEASSCPDPRPGGERSGVERQWDRVLSATLVPSLVVGYTDSLAVGACLDTLGVTAPSFIDALWAAGRCQANKSLSEPQGWMHCADALLPVELVDGPSGLAPRFACALTGGDHVRLAYALVESGQALYELGRSELPTAQGLWGYGLEPLVPATIAALHHARRMLAAEPAHATSDTPQVAARPRAQQPSLALSGGAANGAFTAGYLFTLLSMRERALGAVGSTSTPPGEALAARERIRLNERFGHLVGTSVGSLLAALVDLYFEDASEQGARPVAERLDGPTRASLTECLGAAPGVGGEQRPAQACALALIRAEFTKRQEWHHLCAEQADLEDLFSGCSSNLMRFDLLRHRLIEPFMAQFAVVVAHNDVVRASLAVDLLQNLVVPLDERGCNGLGLAYQQRCQVEAIMASISEPVFASRVDRVWSGLLGDSGEYGLWLDGGLRSGTPSLRALQLTDWPRRALGVAAAGHSGTTRVLAINTNPMHGSVTANVVGAFPVMFRAVDQLVEGTRLWELAATNTYGAYLLMTLGGVGEGAAISSGSSTADSGGSAGGDAGAVGTDAGAEADAGTVMDGGADGGADAGTGRLTLLSGGGIAGAKVRIVRSLPAMLSHAGLVRSVFVPSLLPPQGDGASGYQFDPLTMLRLFILGERAFLEGDPEAVLLGLGWSSVAQWLTPARAAALRADAQRRGEELDRWMADASSMSQYQSLREDWFDDCFVECCEQSLPISAPCDADILAVVGLADRRPRMFFEPMP